MPRPFWASCMMASAAPWASTLSCGSIPRFVIRSDRGAASSNAIPITLAMSATFCSRSPAFLDPSPMAPTTDVTTPAETEATPKTAAFATPSRPCSAFVTAPIGPLASFVAEIKMSSFGTSHPSAYRRRRRNLLSCSRCFRTAPSAPNMAKASNTRRALVRSKSSYVQPISRRRVNSMYSRGAGAPVHKCAMTCALSFLRRRPALPWSSSPRRPWPRPGRADPMRPAR